MCSITAKTLSDEDIKLFEAVEGMDVIVIVNKTDLEQKLDMEQVKQLARESVRSSRLPYYKKKGIDELEEAIQSLFFTGAIESGDLTYVAIHGILLCFMQAKQAIEDAIGGH